MSSPLHLCYQQIAAVLSYRSSNQEVLALLNTKDTNVEVLVAVASDHLVLPAVFYRLKERDLLGALPTDLVAFMRQIALINHNRNQAIVKQVQRIEACFKTYNIRYVLLKGCALLAGAYFKDIGERMLGDIDILVEDTQLELANRLLQTELGYGVQARGVKHHNKHHHLDRLAPTEGLACVELHRAVGKNAIPQILTAKSLFAEANDQIDPSLPKPEALLQHLVYHFFKNHGGYLGKLQANFRSFYDAIVLLEKAPYLTTAFEQYTNLKVFASYHSVYSRHFKNYKPLIAFLFRARLQYPLLSKLWYHGFVLFLRLHLIVTSAAYRHKISNWALGWAPPLPRLWSSRNR